MANDIKRLKKLAKKYDLTQPPDQAVQDLAGLARTVMNTGCYEDWEEIMSILGEAFLARTLRESPAILFTRRAWKYWHRRLIAWDTPVPPMPKRCHLDSNI